MKRFTLSIACCFLVFAQNIFAQSATKSYPFAIGLTKCQSGSSQIHFYNYNAGTNVISNATGGPVNPYTPQLRIGGKAGSTQRFSYSGASISFNPKDHQIYYASKRGSGSSQRTYFWRWPIASPPTNSSNKMDTLCSVTGDQLRLVFGDNGDAFVIEFAPKENGVHKVLIRSLDFTTGISGKADTLILTGGAKIYESGNGDVTISPSGQMFFAVDNKLFTPNYKAYSGTGGQNITCTFIDTIRSNSSGDFVALTYADGEAIGAYWGGGCNFTETEMLTAQTTSITKSGSVYSTTDFATTVSGIGAAKNLHSVTPTGVPNQYIVEYDMYVKNYGNMDVTNVQVTDDLREINRNGNVTNVSTQFIGPKPSTIKLNTSYNGKDNRNLLNSNGILPNYPVEDIQFTIRITCTLSNILPGVVYNNSAIATARDFNGNNLRDVSTNGTNPDLNGNDKPDDAGEDQPTPLLISVVAQTPPCVEVTNVLYSQTFGAGTSMVTSIPAPLAGDGANGLTGTTGYSGRTSGPLPVETYTITNTANSANNSQFINLTDHTGNSNGRMMVVNADAGNNIIYEGSLTKGLCANQQYSLSFYAAFPGNESYETLCDGFGGFKFPKIKMRIIDEITGLIITEATTTDITNTTWQQFGLKFVSPAAYSNIRFQLINDAPGGCGNDLVLDDIEFGNCDALAVVGITVAGNGCIGSSAIFTSSLMDPGAVLGDKEYQWQESGTLEGTYTDISDATTGSYTLPVVTSSDIGKFYRVIVAALGNIGSESCRYISPGTELLAKIQSVKATSAITSHLKICPGKTITLSVEGGSLGTNAQWRWYTSSCGGAVVGTGAIISVTPNTTTTFYVRAEGDCNTTVCEQVTVSISCDIDKDKDGIPDFVESNMPEAFEDHDGDGIINAFDEDYPGFVDNDGDFVNDWFQADGDVDGDGIPNYLDLDFPGRIDINNDGVDDRFDADLDGIPNMFDLDSDNDGIPDVVEAGGVDEDGDGKLDNFIDTDGDGLSDQVDNNLFGAFNSGPGLGLKDNDGDGVPNMFDLDSDADGIPDVREVGGIDANNDGRVDNFIDLNGDGMADHLMGTNALLRTGPDTTGDGRANSYPYHDMDKDNLPNPYDIDSDGDGMLDLIEAGAGFLDTNFDGRVDGSLVNGWTITVSYRPTLVLRDYDKDGKPDYLDIDSDNDGITDHIEGPSTFDYRMPLGIDSDGDGLDDAHDSHPDVWGGSGVFPIDSDGDFIPDYLDSDSDGDGSLDIVEGHDYNFDGIANENTTLTGIDTDGDGLDDRFDLDNTSAKGTSINLGDYGSTNGDSNPGTRAVVQQTPPGASNRDWRYIPFVLPVEIINFTATSTRNNQVDLAWQVNFSSPIDRFEIYRSTDHTTFSRQEKLQVKADQSANLRYSVIDPVALLESNKLFYRLEVIGKRGERLMSNVLSVNVETRNPTITVLPNPAKDQAKLRIHASKEGTAVIKLQDMAGRTLLVLSKNLTTGIHLIPLTNLEKYGSGVFNIQISLNQQIYNIKLVIVK